MSKKGFSTRAIHVGKDKNQYGTLATPIYQSSTFVFDNAEQGGRRFALEEEGYIYTRLGNPTVSVLEKKVADLENAEAAVAFSSGMGAISSVMWTLLKNGDHLIADNNLYGCTFAYFLHGLTKFGIEVDFVDVSNPDNVTNAIKENTKIIYFETPTNPSLKLVDIEKVAEISRKNNCALIVDNTFCSPYLQKPINFGADIVIHSGTKFLNGHGDVVMGIVCGKKEAMDAVRFVGLKDLTGAVMSPFDAFLVTRGLKTLSVRIDRHCENAVAVAKFLEAHPKVEKLMYPGLKSHPQYDLAKKQMDQAGSLISFEVKGGIEAGKKLLNTLEICTLAVSLGDTETLIQHPASMTHSTYTKEEREMAGISDGLIRLSVGLENVEDIIKDLETALDKL